jgi:hypothetical protein
MAQPIEAKVDLQSGQRALHAALLKLSAEIARMYIGALVVLADQDNPDRFAQCAHSLRELMEKLPEYFDVPAKARMESLGAKGPASSPAARPPRASRAASSSSMKRRTHSLPPRRN